MGFNSGFKGLKSVIARNISAGSDWNKI